MDYGDSLIFPGFIDSHVHCYSNLDEGMTNATRAAAHGGITTIFDMPYDKSHPINNEKLFIKKIEDVRNNAYVNVGLWGTIAKNNGVNQLEELSKNGAIGIKLSTFETDPDRFPRIPDEQIVDILSASTDYDMLIAFHAENDDMINRYIDESIKDSQVDSIHHYLTRPPVTETSIVAKLLEFAYWTKSKLHLVHISHPHSVDIINMYKNQYKVNVSLETCYHYLLLDTEDLKHQGALVKCNPAVQEPEVKRELTSLVENKNFDFITSDHAPWIKDLNEKNIFKAPSGLQGLDIMIPLMFDHLVRNNKLDYKAFSDLFSGNVAKRFNIQNKGKIQIGYDADLTVINPNESWKLNENYFESISHQSPFIGRDIHSKVIATIVSGDVVYDGESIIKTNTDKFVKNNA
ncbi:amidohydrolase family protein [Macrococcoides canis]|nr:amidohydrolase family protein [Macrococcus canis]